MIMIIVLHIKCLLEMQKLLHLCFLFHFIANLCATLIELFSFHDCLFVSFIEIYLNKLCGQSLSYNNYFFSFF